MALARQFIAGANCPRLERRGRAIWLKQGWYLQGFQMLSADGVLHLEDFRWMKERNKLYFHVPAWGTWTYFYRAVCVWDTIQKTQDWLFVWSQQDTWRFELFHLFRNAHISMSNTPNWSKQLQSHGRLAMIRLSSTIASLFGMSARVGLRVVNHQFYHHAEQTWRKPIFLQQCLVERINGHAETPWIQGELSASGSSSWSVRGVKHCCLAGTSGCGDGESDACLAHSIPCCSTSEIVRIQVCLSFFSPSFSFISW